MSSVTIGSRWRAAAIPGPSLRCIEQRILRFVCCNKQPTHTAGLASTCLESFPFSSSSSSSSVPRDYPPGLEDVMAGYFFGKKRATEVAHCVWKQVVRKGDTVIDATCGNGHDTLAMLKIVADESCSGRVYAMDIQTKALDNTSALLEELLSQKKELVKLFPLCHSRMEEIIPENCLVRLVAFNLGYLPGGDKSITTNSATTLHALEAAKRILMPGGLISIIVYVGHRGGLEELETVESFCRGLTVENWICSKLELLNQPRAPVPIFLFKR